MSEDTNILLEKWRKDAMETIGTLRDFGYLMKLWQKFPPDQKEFFVMLKMMRNAGLEGWLDGHSFLGLDDLAERLDVNK